MGRHLFVQSLAAGAQPAARIPNSPQTTLYQAQWLRDRCLGAGQIPAVAWGYLSGGWLICLANKQLFFLAPSLLAIGRS